jgi:hypothetical protein
VVASAASASVYWDGGGVDLFGCHHDDLRGDVLLTLDPDGILARASGPDGSGPDSSGPPSTMEFTEVCPIAVRHRIRARVRLLGRLAAQPPPGSFRFVVADVVIDQDGESHQVAWQDYQQAAPDPLRAIATDHVQHLHAHHRGALDLLSRLCGRSALSGATAVVPIGLDRAGLLLRVERSRGHSDVRLGFRTSVASSAGLASELTHLITLARRHRACQLP